jgi:hypothetical protein
MASMLCAMALVCGGLFPQTSTGSLQGTVTDPGDAAVPNLQVELVNTSTGAVRATTSGPEGIFHFNSLQPAKYTLTMKPASGFKAYTQKEIDVTANEVRDLGRIVLALGSVTEEVLVTAAATPVQTASSEKSSLVAGTQLNDLALKGRDLMQMLNLVPGVTSTYSGETSSENGIGNVSINGAPSGKANFMVDGIVDLDTDVSGSDATTHFEPNMDSVAEIRVLTANYQAEFGRNSSGSISVVTKGGSRELHGSAWATKRHEMFNANSYFNNFNGLPKSLYRYFIGGFSVGGPVYIPKVFNKSRNRFFFFVSQEYTRQKPSTTAIYGLAPTALERTGDFSKSLDTTGKLIPLFDPITRLPVPGNAFSPNLASPAGSAMLKFFPLPNRCDLNGNAAGCYNETDSTQINRRNYLALFTNSYPRRNDTVRIDANVTSKLTTWFRYINDYDTQTASGNFALLTSAGNWTPYYEDHPNPGHGYGVGITYTITPTLVNEFTFGKSYNTWDYYPHDPSQVDRARMGNPPSFNNFATDPNFVNDKNQPRPYLAPGSQNFAVWVPSASGATMSFSSTRPYTNWNDIYNPIDSVSWVKGVHNVKAGFSSERTGKVQQGGTGAYLGSYDFSSSSNFPIDTGYGNANMFLGNFNTYSEGGRVMGDDWFTSFEAFVQDSWRVHKRLTLELGVRFYHLGPWENLNNNSAVWLRSSYAPAKAARLYQDGCTVAVPATSACPTKNQVALDPVTGFTTYPSLANTFVPFSVGGYATQPDYFTGAEVAGVSSKIPLSMFTVPYFIPGFRGGLAWDVFGNGKTAIRAGWGQFFQRANSNQPGGPPLTYTRTAYYSNMNQLTQAANAAVTPTSLTSTVGSQKQETSMSTSFGIQQSVGFQTVIEVSYVGAFRRHALQNRQVNPIPIYSQYDPQYMDAWSPYTPKRSINDNNLRPLAGLGGVSTGEFEASTNYNSLQASVRRAMSHGFSYGVAYTFSKTTSASGPSPYWPDKYRNYGASFNGAPSVLVFNYVYQAPNLGKRLNLKPLGWVTDNWTISGITQWQSQGHSGAPSCCSFTGTSTANPAPVMTGSAESARQIVTGDPTIPSDQVSFTNTFNYRAFAFPYPCSWSAGATPQQGVGRSMECFGNAGAGQLFTIPTRLNNWDLTLAKNFPLKGEKRQLTFRAEVYNIFNHTQFSSINSTIQYDLKNWQNGVLVQSNNQLGRFTAARDPRKMAMTLRLQF